jgi:dienelactone hydrolase
MVSEVVRYEADGLMMESHLYLPADTSKPRPGVVVFPEGFGLGSHAKGSAERLAALGYVTIACDLHGEGREFIELSEVMPLLDPLMAEPLRNRARAKAGLDALLARPEVDGSRIAAIGFCFGGIMALELARSGADLRGIVGFHNHLITARPHDAKNIKGKVLILLGADDPGILPDQRADFEQEMREGNVDWQLHLYGGVVHSFTNPEAEKFGRPELRYDAKADAHSWASMIEMFNEILV